MLSAIQLANPHLIADEAMKIQSMRNAFKNSFLKDIDTQCANLCAKKTAQPSVLRLPSDQVEFRWEDILIEMKERAPDVCDFMVAMAVPKVKGNDG